MNIFKWILVGLYVLTIIWNISQIGKPRKPLTPSDVVWATVVSLGVIALVVAA